MTRKAYVARCRRSGDWWAIEVRPGRGLFTQARRLSGVEAMVRDLVALAEGVAPESFDVAVETDLPPDLSAEVDAARELRETADRYQREAAAAARAVAAKLAERHGLPFRDIGRILGVSHQRVGQLLARPEA